MKKLHKMKCRPGNTPLCKGSQHIMSKSLIYNLGGLLSSNWI